MDALRTTLICRLTNSTKDRPASTVADTSIIRPEPHHPPETNVTSEQLSPTTARQQRWDANLENRTLSTVTLTVINEWLKTFRTDDARQRSCRQLGQMLQYAVDSGYLSANPARNATINNVPTPEPTREPVPLTAQQLQALAEQAALGGRYSEKSHDAYKLLILFAGTTGLRWSEVAGLRVDAISFGSRPEVVVRTTLVPVAGRLEFRETTKGRQPRTVPIPGSVAAMLESHVVNLGRSALVFTSPSGAPLRSSNFSRRVLHPAVARCQATDESFPGIVFHDLRRTAVSLSYKVGTGVKVIQDLAGHKSATTTLDVYGHLFADDAQASARGGGRSAESRTFFLVAPWRPSKSRWLPSGCSLPQKPTHGQALLHDS